jgi:hypothetical protein
MYFAQAGVYIHYLYCTVLFCSWNFINSQTAIDVDAAVSLYIHSHVDHSLYLFIFNRKSDSGVRTVLGQKQNCRWLMIARAAT